MIPVELADLTRYRKTSNFCMYQSLEKFRSLLSGGCRIDPSEPYLSLAVATRVPDVGSCRRNVGITAEVLGGKGEQASLIDFWSCIVCFSSRCAGRAPAVRRSAFISLSPRAADGSQSGRNQERILDASFLRSLFQTP